MFLSYSEVDTGEMNEGKVNVGEVCTPKKRKEMKTGNQSEWDEALA